MGEEHPDTLKSKKLLDFINSTIQKSGVIAATPQPVPPVRLIPDTPEYRKLLSQRFEVEKAAEEIKKRFEEYEGFHLLGKKKLKKDEKMVTIKLPRKKDEPAVFVSVNERTWLIQRGVEVEVPACVEEVLRHKEEMEEEAYAFEASVQN